MGICAEPPRATDPTPLIGPLDNSLISLENTRTTNLGTIEARDGGRVHIGLATGPTLLDNIGGVLTAGTGSWFDFSGSSGTVPAATTLRGGTLRGEGEFRMGPTVILDGGADHPITLKNATLAVTAKQLAYLQGELALDNGTITLTDTSFTFGELPRLRASGAARLTGVGSLVINPSQGSEATLDAPNAGDSWTFGSGITALVDGNTAGTISGALTNHGTIRADSGTWYLNSTSLTNTGVIEAVNGGTVRSGVNVTLINNADGILRAGEGATFALSGGTLQGGALNGTGTFQNAGYLYLDGRDDHPITLRDATFLADYNSQTYVYGDLMLDGGTIHLRQTRIGFGNNPPHLTAIGGDANVLGAGRIELSRGYLDVSDPNNAWAFGHDITLSVPAGGTGSINGNLTTHGTLHNDGDLWINSDTTTILPDGTIAGGGYIHVGGGAALVNHGALSPGNSPGTLTIFGNLTQAADSRLLIELAGDTDALRDKLIVTRTLFLAGSLEVDLLEGYLPDPNEAITIVTASGGITGQFFNLADNLLRTEEGFFTVAVESNQIVLSNFIHSPVPEPTALVLIAVCAIFLPRLGAGRRRCRPA